MSPLNDKDLDRLSREAAEQYDAETPASGWDALEKRLNKELPQKDDGDRRRLLFWLLFIVLLSGTGLWWLLRSHDDTVRMQENGKMVASPSERSASGKQDQAPATGNPSAATDPSTDNDTTNSTATPRIGAADPDAATVMHDSPGGRSTSGHPGNPTLSNKSGTTITEPQPALSLKQPGGVIPSHKKITGGRKPKREEKNIQEDAAVPFVAGQNNQQKNKIDKPVTVRAENPTAKTVEPEKEKVVTHPPANIPPVAIDTTNKKITENIAKKPTATTDTTASIAPPKKPAAAKTTRQPLEIGLLIGPDLSNVKFSSAGKGGLNLGLQIGYRFNNRWSVNTGVIYTKKYYEARGKDFKKPAQWQYIDLQSIDGNCSMFDIPLNVRYNLTTTKNKFFVSTGLSTYIMDREFYDYYYIYQGELRKNDWETNKNSNYVFSILNFSAGLERPISKQFSLQAEPYLKMPLKGVGHGKLQLNSYGINFSLKYTPVFKVKTKK